MSANYILSYILFIIIRSTDTVIANMKYESDTIKKIEILIMLEREKHSMFNIFFSPTLYPFTFCLKETSDPICINIDFAKALTIFFESFDNCIFRFNCIFNLMNYRDILIQIKSKIYGTVFIIKLWKWFVNLELYVWLVN